MKKVGVYESSKFILSNIPLLNQQSLSVYKDFGVATADSEHSACTGRKQIHELIVAKMPFEGMNTQQVAHKIFHAPEADYQL